MNPTIDLGSADLDATGLEYSHSFRIQYLAITDGFAKEWEMGNWNAKRQAFICKSLTQLLSDYLRTNILNSEENFRLTDELHDRALERLQSRDWTDASLSSKKQYPMIWTFEKLLQQEQQRLAEEVLQSLWAEERQQLNREMSEYYQFHFNDCCGKPRRAGPMLLEFWRRLAQATGKLACEHCF
jgi:hypothetical protein